MLRFEYFPKIVASGWDGKGQETNRQPPHWLWIDFYQQSKLQYADSGGYAENLQASSVANIIQMSPIHPSAVKFRVLLIHQVEDGNSSSVSVYSSKNVN